MRELEDQIGNFCSVLIARRILPIPTKDYPTAARRPVYSVLSNNRLTHTFSLQLSDWRAQLNSVFDVYAGGSPNA
jgi:dTDP-4-dehydrorhamnose reductase